MFECSNVDVDTTELLWPFLDFLPDLFLRFFIEISLDELKCPSTSNSAGEE